MPIKNLVAAVVAPGLVLWAGAVLWPTSHCDRVAKVAAPVYWAGHVLRMGLEPIVPESWQAGVQAMPLQLQSAVGGVVARVVYNRESYAMLCATDPVEQYRRHGLLDDRGLIALDPEDRVGPQAAPGSEPRAAPAPQQPAVTPVSPSAPASSSIAAPPHIPQEQGGFFAGLAQIAVPVAVVGALAVLFIAPLRKMVFDGIFSGSAFLWMLAPLRKVANIHTRLLEHFMPRSVVRPSAGKDKTDLT